MKLIILLMLLCGVAEATYVKVGGVSQAVKVGDITFGTDCGGMSRTNTAYGDLTDASCATTTTGNISAIAGVTAGFSIANASAGSYLAVFTGSLYRGNTTAVNFRFYDGTNQWSEDYTVNSAGFLYSGSINSGYTYASSPGTLTVKLQCKASSGSCQINGDGGTLSKIEVYYFPSSSQQTVRVGAEEGIAIGNFSNTCKWSTTSAASSPVFAGGDATCTFSSTSYGITLTQIADGTGVQPGYTASIPSAGKYEACFYANIYTGNASHAAQAFLYVDDVGPKASAITNSTISNGQTLCAVVDIASTGNHTFKMYQGTQTAGQTASIGDTYDNNSIFFTLKKLTQNVPQPVIVNSVTTPYSGQVNTVFTRAAGATKTTVCSSTPCTLYGNAGVSSVTRNATGDYTINVASGVFPGDHFDCNITLISATSAVVVKDPGYTDTATAYQFQSVKRSDATNLDVGFSANCWGIK